MRVSAPVKRVFFWAGVVCLLLPAAAGVAWADRVVNANEPIVISDDITDMTRPVRSAAGVTGGEPATSSEGSTAPPGGDGEAAATGGGSGPDNDNDRSGLGDDTNPGQGSGTDNSPNTGTNNPGGLKENN